MQYENLIDLINNRRFLILNVDGSLVQQIQNSHFTLPTKIVNGVAVIDDGTQHIIINPTLKDKKSVTNFLLKIKGLEKTNILVLLTEPHIYFTKPHKSITHIDYPPVFDKLNTADWLTLYRYLIQMYEGNEISVIQGFFYGYTPYLVMNNKLDYIPYTNILVSKYLSKINNDVENTFIHFVAFISELYTHIHLNKTISNV